MSRVSPRVDKEDAEINAGFFHPANADATGPDGDPWKRKRMQFGFLRIFGFERARFRLKINLVASAI
jgi:hypothetical protein